MDFPVPRVLEPISRSTIESTATFHMRVGLDTNFVEGNL
jgi:hypothetical protein